MLISLGRWLRELAGRRPFDDRDPAAHLAAVLADDPPLAPKVTQAGDPARDPSWLWLGPPHRRRPRQELEP